MWVLGEGGLWYLRGAGDTLGVQQALLFFPSSCIVFDGPSVSQITQASWMLSTCLSSLLLLICFGFRNEVGDCLGLRRLG